MDNFSTHTDNPKCDVHLMVQIIQAFTNNRLWPDLNHSILFINNNLNQQFIRRL